MNDIESAVPGDTGETPSFGEDSASGQLPAVRRSRLPFVVAAVVLAALLVGGGLWWRSFTRSPAYSLGQLAKAVDNKDWDGVQKYVDIEALVNQVVDTALAQSIQDDDTGFGALAAGFAQSLKPSLVQQAKEAFREGVEQDGGSSEGAPFAGYFSAKKVKSVTYIGDEALVTVEVPDDGGEDFELKLKMKRVDDFWRVVGIENIMDLPAGGDS